MSGFFLVRMVFVQVVFVRGGFCPYTTHDKRQIVPEARCCVSA